MAKKCLVEEEVEWYLDKKENALKVTRTFKAGVVRHFFGSVIPWRDASQQSQPPFHQTKASITELDFQSRG
jgi:hypothetical protein